MTSETSALSPREYAGMHKRAFREGFDYLNAHFPPQNDSEWWKKACDDLNAVMKRNNGNGMLTQMMIGVVTYLEEVNKARKEDAGADAS